MPGFTIHIAIGKQYIAKHEREIKDTPKFMKGVIAPDLDDTMTQITRDKLKTHYGMWCNSENNFRKFFNDEKVDINEDFWKGYFLHLLTDYYFYNNQFREETEESIRKGDLLYKDYDCLNFELIEKYKIEIKENISQYMNVEKTNERPKYLEKEKVIDFIEEISSLDLKELIEKMK